MKSTGLQARPTTYNGVQMRSRLEAGFAQWLDEMRFNWEYEPECFGSERGQWLPDFKVDAVCVPGGHPAPLKPLYVEVKPVTFKMDGSYWRRLAGLYESTPDAAAVLAQEGTAPILIYPIRLLDGVIHEFESEPMDWTWTGLWPIDARRVEGPWPHEWWKGVPA